MSPCRISRTTVAGFAITAAVVVPPTAQSQQAPARQPYVVGNPVGLPMVPDPRTPGAPFEAASPNVKVFGAIYSAESCSYDTERGVIVVPNRGVPQGIEANNAWVSLINHDGSVHTARWIGYQFSQQRAALDPPLVLNEPFGSDIVNGVLYLADRDGGTSATDPSVAVIRRFDMRTGAPLGSTRIEGAPFINDIAVANDGTVYGTQTGDFGDNPNPASWQVWRVAPDGRAEVFATGKPLFQPNGIAFDAQGNIVVVNVGDAAVLTFSPTGALLKTEAAAQSGSDGLVIMPDGTKYVSSVRLGGVSRIRPGQPAELFARNIPNAASMCYDAGANQLVIPMNANNALAFISLGAGSGR
jgi:hypothetical protein